MRELGAALKFFSEADGWKIVRVKNRFEQDVVEDVSAERLQAEFYAAETGGEEFSTLHQGQLVSTDLTCRPAKADKLSA